MSRLSSFLGVIVFFAAVAPLSAQRIAVQPGSRPMGKQIVQVGPSAARTPVGAYQGVRQVRSWQYFSGPGPARARANYEGFANRFRPSFRTWGLGFGGYAPIVGPQSRVFLRRW
jgi:hypothetical protein